MDMVSIAAPVGGPLGELVPGGVTMERQLFEFLSNATGHAQQLANPANLVRETLSDLRPFVEKAAKWGVKGGEGLVTPDRVDEQASAGLHRGPAFESLRPGANEVEGASSNEKALAMLKQTMTASLDSLRFGVLVTMVSSAAGQGARAVNALIKAQ
jgi:hypothetical protein